MEEPLAARTNRRATNLALEQAQVVQKEGEEEERDDTHPVLLAQGRVAQERNDEYLAGSVGFAFVAGARGVGRASWKTHALHLPTRDDA